MFLPWMSDINTYWKNAQIIFIMELSWVIHTSFVNLLGLMECIQAVCVIFITWTVNTMFLAINCCHYVCVYEFMQSVGQFTQVSVY